MPAWETSESPSPTTMPGETKRPSEVKIQWGVKIPLRDGVHLNATLYLPEDLPAPTAAIFTLTPYVGQMFHDRGVYFASRGFPFLTVDVRGRGNSEGEFRPLIQEACDGFDGVEWVARQPYCNGKVAMWGGSYGGHVQWATAKELPPHLISIAPVASVHPGVDFPLRANIFRCYTMQWLTFVSGKALQDRIFADRAFWSRQFQAWFESGEAFSTLDTFVGNPSPVFQEWLAHPEQSEYWDGYNPTPHQYAALSLPVLTITGIYDGDQLGALTYYREHLKQASAAARVRHYLIIGPWDHAGTRDPKTEFYGLKVGAASLLDLNRLHLEWYAWTMQDGPKPEFLRKNVAYYVMGAEEWRYADSLEEITARVERLYLHSAGNPTDVFHSGSLDRRLSDSVEPDEYVHDPRDISLAELESTIDPYNAADQQLVHARAGRQLIYHSAPFEHDLEIAGFFKLEAWLAIDRRDADFHISIYEITLDGASVLLTGDSLRARYRESLCEARLVDTQEPLRYEFKRFNFVARRLQSGSRLRLTIGPLHSIYSQKNHHSGGVIAAETWEDIYPVTMKLYHEEAHPSALYVPWGHRE